MGDTYTILNAEELNRQSPDTFHIPDRNLREDLIVGDLAKMMFEFDEEPTHQRMWVVVTGKADVGYTGKLDNYPAGTDAITAGDLVEFGPEHVIDLWQRAKR